MYNNNDRDHTSDWVDHKLFVRENDPRAAVKVSKLPGIRPKYSISVLAYHDSKVHKFIHIQWTKEGGKVQLDGLSDEIADLIEQAEDSIELELQESEDKRAELELTNKANGYIIPEVGEPVGNGIRMIDSGSIAKRRTTRV
jgi:hypothetical protein